MFLQTPPNLHAPKEHLENPCGVIPAAMPLPAYAYRAFPARQAWRTSAADKAAFHHSLQPLAFNRAQEAPSWNLTLY